MHWLFSYKVRWITFEISWIIHKISENNGITNSIISFKCLVLQTLTKSPQKGKWNKQTVKTNDSVIKNNNKWSFLKICQTQELKLNINKWIQDQRLDLAGQHADQESPVSSEVFYVLFLQSLQSQLVSKVDMVIA